MEANVMTKRIVSGIFILTALGALGVILAGALTSGEQLIVRFLTAVIVAALGLYVISDLRLQADDDAMSSRSGGPTRLATVDAPPNSTAAFMATVTKKVDPHSVGAPGEEDLEHRELLQTTVLSETSTAEPPPGGPANTPPPPLSPQERANVRSTDDGAVPAPGSGKEGRRSVSSRPKAPDTINAFGPLTEGSESQAVSSDDSTDSEESSEEIAIAAANGEVSDVDSSTGEELNLTDQDQTAQDQTAQDQISKDQTSKDTAAVDDDAADATSISNVRDLFGLPAPSPATLSEELPAANAEADEINLDPAAESEDVELVGSLAGVSGGVIDATGSFRPHKGLNGAGERNGSHTGPFDLTSTTAKISFSNDPLGDNVSLGNGILNGSHGTTPNGAAQGDNPSDGETQNGTPQNGEHVGNHDAPIDTTLTGDAAAANGDDADAEFTYSDDLQSPEHVWPAPPTAANGHTDAPMASGSAHLRFDDHQNGAANDAANGNGQALPVPAAETELRAAEYADAPLAPIIDLRDLGTQATDTVDLAINAGEVEVITTLIEQGMLSTDGPISDRDVRTMVYVAFTSNELRKLLLAGGSPEGPNYGLDLGPVELFDERIHAPAPKTLYSGINHPEAKTQLG